MALLVTAAEMRALDREVQEQIGVPGVVLMESAGRAVVEVMARHYALLGRRVVCFCGPGNNGGDGFVIARCLLDRGAAVTVALAGSRARISGDARVHFEACLRAGVEVRDGVDLELARGDLVVDALFGTGLTRPVAAGAALSAIERMQAHEGPVVAVDVPSGLDADRGVIGPAVRAERTVTFAFAKLGLCQSAALPWVGQLHVVDIGVPTRLARARGVKAELLDEEILEPLRARDPEGHKGSHGHVLVVAGSRGKTGAALLCGTAVLRCGAGLCTVALSADAAAAIEGRVPELMIEPLGALPPLLTGKRVAAIGPGLPRDESGHERLRTLVASSLPLVIDADGLNAIAATPTLLPRRQAPTVLTPHPGEAARLLGTSVPTIQADRVAAARALVDRFAAICVLKGARTVIAAPDGRLAINPTGNPGLGTGGTGDVLTGCVAAALARHPQGAALDPFVAACGAVYLHGAAGDRAAALRSQTGLLASDVIDALPQLLRPRCQSGIKDSLSH